MHLVCQMRRRFSVLKRGALFHTFVGKLKIAVNLFTPIVAALTASECANSLIPQKAKWFGEFEMGRRGFPESRDFGTGWADQCRCDFLGDIEATLRI
jgi:hypothetical protein